MQHLSLEPLNHAEISPPTLPLKNMAERHLGLTPALAESYVEAARVCLDRHHTPPQECSIGTTRANVVVLAHWEAADDQIRRSYANETDTTEAGAYACVIATVELAEGLFAVRRAETRTGADYYVAPAGEGLDDLEGCFRLEISGVDTPGKSAVEKRLRQKVLQTQRGNSSLPAIAGVIGFPSLLIRIERVMPIRLTSKGTTCGVSSLGRKVRRTWEPRPAWQFRAPSGMLSSGRIAC